MPSIAARNRERPTPRGYQNTVVYVEDDHGVPVRDYFIEVFAKQASKNAVDQRTTTLLQREVMASVHTNKIEAASRSLKMNCDILQTQLMQSLRPLFLSVTAHPEIRDTGSVGYSTIAYNDIGSIRIDVNELGQIFRADRTLFVHLMIKRMQLEKLVRFQKL